MAEPEKIVVKRKAWHCERGAGSCIKCDELEKNPKSKYLFALYSIGGCDIPEVAHPHYSLPGQKTAFYGGLCDSNILQKFKTEKEAKEYAKKNKIEFVEA